MANKPVFASLEEARFIIKKCCDDIGILKDHHMLNPNVVCAVGKSLIHQICSICEGILYLICDKYSTPEGTIEWPSLKDLKEKGKYVNAPTIAGHAAKGMIDIKKECDKTDVTLDALVDFFSSLSVFLEWAKVELPNNNMIGAAEFLQNIINEYKDCYKREIRRQEEDPRLYFRYYDGIDFDSMTDEEVDQYYRPRKGNSRKSLVPLFIYLILKEHTDWNTRFRVKDIIMHLEEDYELRTTRGPVERYLNVLIDDDVNIHGGNPGDGYWYSECRPNY